MIARFDAPQIEQRVEVLCWPARDDGQDMQVCPVVDHARHLRRQSQWRAFDQAGGKADRPGVDLFLLRPKVERPRWNWLLSRRRRALLLPRLSLRCGTCCLQCQEHGRQHCLQPGKASAKDSSHRARLLKPPVIP